MEIFILIIILAMIECASHFTVGAVLYLVDEDWPVFYTPATFYELTNMNWFGCIIAYIILLPFAFVFEIGGILKWLFTVGRKD